MLKVRLTRELCDADGVITSVRVFTGSLNALERAFPEWHRCLLDHLAIPGILVESWLQVHRVVVQPQRRTDCNKWDWQYQPEKRQPRFRASVDDKASMVLGPGPYSVMAHGSHGGSGYG